MGVPIGELDVIIQGDYSQLTSDFAEATAQSTQAAKTIGEAFTASATASNSLNERIEALVASGMTLREALDADAAAMGKLQDMSTGAASATEAVAGGADTAAKGLQSYSDSAKKAADASVQGSAAAAEFLQTLIGFGGIALTLEGLRRGLVETIEAFDRVDDATTALTALTGSARTAVDNIEKMRELAQSNALSFPDLLKADQNMAAFGFDAAKIPGLLQAAADAAAVTGKGFDATAQALERIVATGHLAGRQLVALGLTVEDVAKVMGKSTDEAADFFKTLDSSARIDVITQSLGKFAGLAAKTTDDVLGDWQRLKNQAEFTFEGVGQAIDPAGRALIKLASISLENITPAIVAIGDLSREIVTTVSLLRDAGGQFSTFVERITGVPVSIADVTTALRNMNLVFGTMAPYVVGLTEFLKLMNSVLGKTAEAAPGVQKTAEATDRLAKVDVKPAADGLQAVATASKGAIENVSKLDPIIADLTKTMRALGAESTTAGAAFTNAWTLSVMQSEVKAVSDAVKELLKTQTDASDKLEIARGVLVSVRAAYRDHKATIDDVVRAENGFREALDAAHPKLKEDEAAIKALTEAYHQWSAALKDPSAFVSFGDTLDAISAKVNNLTRTIIKGFADQGAAFVEWSSHAMEAAKVIEVLNGSVVVSRAKFDELGNSVGVTSQVIYGHSAAVKEAATSATVASSATAGYADHLTALTSTTSAATAAQQSLASAIRQVNASILEGGNINTAVNSGPGGTGGGGRGGGAQLFDPNNPNAGGYIVTNGGRNIDYIRPNSVIPFGDKFLPGAGGGGGGSPAQAPIGGVIGGIDFGALASGIPTALGQVQTSIYATVPAATSLTSAVATLAGTTAAAASTLLSTAAAIAVAAGMPPPPEFSSTPLALGLGSGAGIAPTLASMPPPGQWSASAMKLGAPSNVYIYNPTVTNQTQLDQMTTQIQNAGVNTR